jgi:hypothetical protein
VERPSLVRSSRSWRHRLVVEILGEVVLGEVVRIVKVLDGHRLPAATVGALQGVRESSVAVLALESGER